MRLFSVNREFKFKVPCASVEQKTFVTGYSGLESTEHFSCLSGQLKFTVSSKKAKSDLSEEFEELKKEKAAMDSRHNGMSIIEFGRNETITTENSALPNGKVTIQRKFWNKVYLINDKWLINFEADCENNEEVTCEESFAYQNEVVKSFFNSLKILKK